MIAPPEIIFSKRVYIHRYLYVGSNIIGVEFISCLCFMLYIGYCVCRPCVVAIFLHEEVLLNIFIWYVTVCFWHMIHLLVHFDTLSRCVFLCSISLSIVNRVSLNQPLGYFLHSGAFSYVKSRCYAQQFNEESVVCNYY